jgi:hypothetical protein
VQSTILQFHVLIPHVPNEPLQDEVYHEQDDQHEDDHPHGAVGNKRNEDVERPEDEVDDKVDHDSEK